MVLLKHSASSAWQSAPRRTRPALLPRSIWPRQRSRSTRFEMIALTPPAVELVRSYLNFLEELRGARRADLASARNRTKARRHLSSGWLRERATPAPDRVPATTYWATESGDVVGRIALRHRLNDALAEFGGHIGYEVRPSCRRRGIGAEMLRQLLGNQRGQTDRSANVDVRADEYRVEQADRRERWRAVRARGLSSELEESRTTTGSISMRHAALDSASPARDIKRQERHRDRGRSRRGPPR